MSAPCNCICCFLNAWIKYLCYAIVNARTMILIPFGWSHFFHFFISLTRLFVQQSHTSSTNCCDHSFRQISLVIVLKLMWVLARLLTDLHTLIVICFWFIRQLVKSFHSFHWSPCTNQMVGGGGGWFSLHLFVYLQDWEISLHLLVYLRDWEISPDLRWDFCMCKTCPSKFWPRNENNCYLTGSGAKLSWREGVGGERINQSIFKSGQWHCFLGDWRLLFFFSLIWHLPFCYVKWCI